MENSTADVVLLFSGGRDSSLAACRLSISGKRIILFHCLNGTSVQSEEVAKVRYNLLYKRFPDNIVDFVVTPIYGSFRRLALMSMEKDILDYKSNLVCLGCKMASHVEAIIYCLTEHIGIIADGYTSYQSHGYLEQRPESIEVLKNLSAEYGILYINPVYEMKDDKSIKYNLLDYGISTKSIEGSCMFGSTYSIPGKEAIISYLYKKLPICREIIKQRNNEYAQMKQKPKIHKIGAIILNNKKLLVVRKTAGNRIEYIIPGGKPELGETHEDTLRRELREELKIELVRYSPFGSFSETAIFENIPIFMDVYYADISGIPTVDSEIKDLLWIDSQYEEKGIKLGSVLAKHVIPKLQMEGLM